MNKKAVPEGTAVAPIILYTVFYVDAAQTLCPRRPRQPLVPDYSPADAAARHLHSLVYTLFPSFFWEMWAYNLDNA